MLGKHAIASPGLLARWVYILPQYMSRPQLLLKGAHHLYNMSGKQAVNRALQQCFGAFWSCTSLPRHPARSNWASLIFAAWWISQDLVSSAGQLPGLLAR